MTSGLWLIALLAAAAPSRAEDFEGARAAAERDFGAAPASFAGLRLDPRAAAPEPPKVCSVLDFGGASWPGAFTADDRDALEIGLNISGSYEGADGWANLSDNFDGQGVSAGLLNQNLGQGSLQPMLIRLRDEHPETLKVLVGPARLASLLGMLSKWESAARLDSENAPLSALDEPGEEGAPRSVGANKASVDWAVANLYSGGRFVPAWKSELTAVVSSPEYVTIQIAAAVADHDRAVADENRIGVRELRSYLTLLDFQVQNGGLYAADLADYDAYLKEAPRATATQKLEKLLTLRLRHVRKQYVADVRARKLAIILGTGKVHGENRDLPVQYCYDGLWPYREASN